MSTVEDDELKRCRRAAYKANAETFELAKRRDIPALIERLQSPLETEDFSIRFAALAHLGKLGAREAIPHIVPLLEHEDFATRAGAVVALTRLDARDAAGQVARALEDEHPGVRQRAAEGLSTLGRDDPSAVAALVRALDDDVWHVRRCALTSLSTLGDVTAIPAIEAFTRREGLWRRRHATRAVRVLRRN
jgi:HEAT repeat protein